MSYGRGVKTVVSPGGILHPGDTVYEQVQTNEYSVQYAVKEKTSDKISLHPFLKPSEHVVYQPLSPSPWVLPPPPQKYGSLDQLWKKIRKFVWDHLDLEREIHYDIFVAWILVSWLPERWDSAPYLHFHGPSNSGKTRALDILNLLAYRPLLSPSVSPASIYRAIDAYHPTFLLDEFELYEKQRETKTEVIGVLNAGYRRGQVVLRVDKVRDGAPLLRPFNVFGPKAVGSIMSLPVALNGRCIRFSMSRAVRKVKRLMDKNEAVKLRAMLLQYRMDHVLDPPLKGNPLDLPDGRLIELYLPLVTVAPKPLEIDFLNYAKEQYVETIEEERATEDAKVYQTIIDLLMEQPRLKLPQQDIRMKINTQLSEKDQYRPTKLGFVLRRLGLKSETQSGTRLKVVIIDVKVLNRRKVRYVLPSEMKAVDELFNKLSALSTSITLSTSEGGVDPQKGLTPPINDVNDVNDVNNAIDNVDVITNKSKVNAKTLVVPPEGEMPTTCWLCHRLLPSNWENVTLEEGKPCHMKCAVEWRKTGGRKA